MSAPLLSVHHLGETAHQLGENAHQLGEALVKPLAARAPFAAKPSRLRRKRNLLLAVPVLGALGAAVAYWSRTREVVPGDSARDTGVREQVQQALRRVGIAEHEGTTHAQASAASGTASAEVPPQHRSA